MRPRVGGDCDYQVSLPRPDHLSARNTNELPSLLVLNNHSSFQENFFRLQGFRLWSLPAYFLRTGTPFNHLLFPTDIVLLVVLWRLRYKLSLRDLAEMFLVRGFEFTKEAL